MARWQSAAGLGGGFREQAFVIALQPQEGLRVSADDVDQPAACVGMQFGTLRRLAYQLQCGFQFAGIGLEALALDRVALGKVLAQHPGRPLAKTRPLQRLDPIADGDDHVEAIEPDRLVRPGNVQILHIAGFFQFAFLKQVAEMLGDDRPLAPKQPAHLLLPEPDGSVRQSYFGNAGAILRRIDEDIAGRCFGHVCLLALGSIRAGRSACSRKLPNRCPGIADEECSSSLTRRLP